MNRSSGILLHISSLPSDYGIGSLGANARRFVDFLARAGQRWWQILPIGPTSYGDSPYQCCSIYAGNPYFIDLELLRDDGLLENDELNAARRDPRARVDYGDLFHTRYPLLRAAFGRGRERFGGDLAAFRAENPWVEDYALFMALKLAHGFLPWAQWPEGIAKREPAALAEAREALREDVDFYAFLQFLFYRQWDALRDYARSKNVKIIGDLPIYVPYDAVDVWSYPELFQLDRDGTPTGVAGVPPDAFTADGQLWGNPLYRWPLHKKTGFAWWIERVKAAGRCFDAVRIDHFRGLESYWAVPWGDETARNGKWIKGPGMAFVRAIKRACPETEFIAEDLGYMTPEVLALQEGSGWPGMKILQFAFDHPGNAYLPHNYPQNCICYTGTHDNETLRQWWEHAPDWQKQFAADYFGLNEREGLLRGIIRGGMGSVATLFVAQLQDWLELGGEARMNEPGALNQANWTWKLDALPGDALADEIAAMTRRFAR